jgi:hypothetical protein
MSKIPITALEELVKTNLILFINNPTKVFKVGELKDITILGPGDDSVMKFYFANKKGYKDKNLHFINEDSDIIWGEGDYVSFHINGKTYEVHRRGNTMPEGIEYVNFSQEGYKKRWAELSR